ncbi:MAG TPA: peptidase C69 [Candidatus Margulisbacteria bacterium]|nr:MAG: hypothetical protein A2X43_13835 [Candidatus Margulisbacteria bacterium GWD2_39_127]OGI05542.1 MAG: hypothetical protein A2X42_00615 [Candidatus Margulisbacteria bacterium GWF2_38_17]OGI08377.1 MAG: hypothetical protein A2X41_10725 [Candidatus Margulisbacteria bacterium GWE2_39_32]HAR63142.1 peptidase C69 [Candidatus Margulisiibacteriota bacterium]HCT84114.1 peptidase C69 [Candidatus Margulisiibacteriota bacterium]
MIEKKLSEEIIDTLSESGARFCELFAEKTKSTMVFMEQSKVEKITAGIDSGIGLRIVEGAATAYAYVNSMEKDRVLSVAKELSKVFKAGQKKRSVTLLPLQSYNADYIKIVPESVGLGEKIELLYFLDKTGRSVSPLINQVSLRYGDSEQEIYIANSEGIHVRDVRIRSRFMINVIAQKDGIIQTGYEGPGESRGWEYIKELPVEKIARKAAQRAVNMLDAALAPAGKMMVVLSGEAGGTMIHEACGHSLEADFIHKKTSIFSESLGKMVASPLITVIDDGSLAYKYGYSAVDDEGTKTSPSVLIEKGVLKNFINDKMSANLLNMPPTGNGRRENYRNKPVPRMTNTYIANGETDPQAIVDSVSNGLLVTKMGGGQVNTTNGDFVFEVSEGFIIKNGKVAELVRGATLTGNGPEVLKSVDMVGNDLTFIPGVCGKGDHVPVSDAQPTLRIPEIVVGGQV